MENFNQIIARLRKLNEAELLTEYNKVVPLSNTQHKMPARNVMIHETALVLQEQNIFPKGTVTTAPVGTVTISPTAPVSEKDTTIELKLTLTQQNTEALHECLLMVERFLHSCSQNSLLNNYGEDVFAKVTHTLSKLK